MTSFIIKVIVICILLNAVLIPESFGKWVGKIGAAFHQSFNESACKPYGHFQHAQ